MSETPAPPGAETSRGSENSPASEFKPGWLIEDEEQFKKLRTGQLGTPGKKIAMLHETGLAETLNPDQIADRAAKLGDEAVDEGEEVWSGLTPYFVKMTDRVRTAKNPEPEKPTLDSVFPGSKQNMEQVTQALAVAGLVLAGKFVKDKGGKVLGTLSDFLAGKLGLNPKQQAGESGSGGSSGNEPPSSGGNGGQAEKGPSNEGNNFFKMSFAQLEARKSDSGTTPEQLAAIESEQGKLVQELVNFENGGFLDGVQRSARATVRNNSWDDVYDKLDELGISQEKQLRDASGDNPRWNGILRQGLKAEAARVVIAGITRARKGNQSTVNEDWLEKHDYSKSRIARLLNDANKRIDRLELLPNVPEELVGKGLPKQDATYRQAGGVDGDESPDYPPNMDQILGRLNARDNREYEAAAPIPPDYIVATFKQSKYRRYERGWTEVEFLDIRDKDQLKRWAFLNMRVFNDGTIPGVEKGWKNILDVWLGDLKDSTRRAGLEKDGEGKLVGLTEEQRKNIEETRKDLIAMMAASSSGRAMEQSDGGAADYVATITQSQADRPDIGKQDTWKEFLLADDPGKYKRLVEMPLVKDFYNRVLEDAGVVVEGECGNQAPEVWDDFRGKSTPTRKISEFHLVADSDGRTPLAISKKDGLVSFFSNKEGNGFEDYIKNLLSNEEFMKSIGRDSTKAGDDDYAAARLACDAFLVEKFTRWEMALTDGYNPSSKSELRINPFKGWGGDPFGMTEEPGKLPRRFKNKYQGKDSGVLVMFDNSFRPLDIFSGARADERVRGTGVAHLKNFYRLNAAMWTALGGSTAPNLPNWSPKTLQEELPDIADKIDQVYGSYTEPAKNKDGKYLGLRVDAQRNLLLDAQRNPIEVVIDDRNRDDKNRIIIPEGVIRKDNPIGKEIGGAICVRLAETKALALTLESRSPGFKDYVRVMFQGPTARPYYEIEKLIWGENLDGSSGFLASLAGARTRFILNRNRFGADENITSLWNLLTTNDQDPNGRGKMETANRLGFLLDVVQAVASGGKPRK